MCITSNFEVFEFNVEIKVKKECKCPGKTMREVRSNQIAQNGRVDISVQVLTKVDPKLTF